MSWRTPPEIAVGNEREHVVIDEHGERHEGRLQLHGHEREARGVRRAHHEPACAENLPTAVYCGTDDPFCGQLQTSDVSAQVRREAAARARAAAPQPENKFERISGLAIPSMPELPSMPSLPSF